MTPAWCGDACVPAGRLPALVQLRQAACIRTRAPGWGCRVQGSGEVVPERRNMITVRFKKKEVQKNLTSRVSHLKQCRSGYLALQYLSKGKAAYLRSCFRDRFRFLKNRWGYGSHSASHFPHELWDLLKLLQTRACWDWGSELIDLATLVRDSPGQQGALCVCVWGGGPVNLFSKASCQASLHSLHTFLSSEECSSVKCWGLLGWRVV